MLHLPINLWRKNECDADPNSIGIETTGVNPAKQVYFDHDGDGLKTATGWTNDTFLVMDRNDDGTINDGTELFGDSTTLYPVAPTEAELALLAESGQALPAPGPQKAADGFEALAQEDTNADGRVDALDANFDKLRLWQDANQDGISQADELTTLDAQGITALNVAKTENTERLDNGNIIADLGSFIRSDGSTGQLADADFILDRFYTQFADSVPVTEAAQGLPDFGGGGQVRSLRQAASLDTPEGQALATKLAAFAAETTYAGQMAQIDDLLKTWSETSTMATMVGGAYAGIDFQFSVEGAEAGSPEYQGYVDKLSVIDRFNGSLYLSGAGIPAPGTVEPGSVIEFQLQPWLISGVDTAYQQLKEDLYDALVMQTRLAPYLEEIALKIDDTGIALDFSGLEAKLDALHSTAAGATNALIDRIELTKYAGEVATGGMGRTGEAQPVDHRSRKQRDVGEHTNRTRIALHRLGKHRERPSPVWSRRWRNFTCPACIASWASTAPCSPSSRHSSAASFASSISRNSCGIRR